MADVLSQNQIDALLNSISSGQDVLPVEESGGVIIRNYDFYSPKKFTKEQLRTIDSLHENLGRLLSSYFSGILRVYCDISVVQVEEQRYYEYNNALPDTAMISLIDLKPANINLPDATLMLDMSNNLSFFLIDRLLGGPGGNGNLQRDFTDIELAIMNDIFTKVNEFMMESWREHLEVTTELNSIETNPRLIQVYAPEDIVVITSMSVKVRDMEGTLSICIPAIGLESYLGEFISKYSRISHRMYNEQVDSMRRELIQDALYDTELEVKAVFDETSIEVADALRLRPNDIIPLAKPLNGIVKIEVDSNPWFSAQLGSSRKRKSVKIIELLDAGEDEPAKAPPPAPVETAPAEE